MSLNATVINRVCLCWRIYSGVIWEFPLPSDHTHECLLWYCISCDYALKSLNFHAPYHWPSVCCQAKLKARLFSHHSHFCLFISPIYWRKTENYQRERSILNWRNPFLHFFTTVIIRVRLYWRIFNGVIWEFAWDPPLIVDMKAYDHTSATIFSKIIELTCVLSKWWHLIGAMITESSFFHLCLLIRPI